MLIIPKTSVCLISVLVTVNSMLIVNSFSESNYELNKEICGPEFIYCSDSNVCLNVECTHKSLFYVYKFNNNSDYCPKQTNYCEQFDECLPNCPKESSKRENRYSNVFKSNENTKNQTENNNNVLINNMAIDSKNVVTDGNIMKNHSNNNINDKKSSKRFSAKFSHTFDSIWISFESLLEPQGLIECSLIFETKSIIKLGSETECHIIRNEILIILRKNATILPNDDLTFNDKNSVKQIQEIQFGSEENKTNIMVIDIIDGTFSIDRPLNQSLPYLTINGLHQTCSNNKSAQLIVDNIIGNSGQPLKLKWSVRIVDNDQSSLVKDNFDSNTEEILRLMPDNVYNNAFIEVNSDLLKPNRTYELSVFAENRFGIKSLSTQKFLLSLIDRKNFMINVNGLTFVDVSIDNMFTAELIFCNYTNDEYFIDSFEFVWRLESNEFIIKRHSTDILYINANKLIGGRTYKLIVSARYLVNNESDIYTHEFETTLEPLIALINTNYLSIGKGQDFLLDGSASYDPSNTEDQMNYKWICYDIKRDHEIFLNKSESPVLVTIPLLNITSNFSELYLETGDYNFTLQISKGERKSSAFVIVKILSQKVPKVHFSPTEYEKRFKVNPNKAQVITGFVTSHEKTVENWETNSNLTNILDMNDVQKLSNNKMRSIELKIPEPYSWPNWFGLHTNKFYNFTLNSRHVNEQEVGFSSITIGTNDPPTLGFLEVVPKIGIKLHQKFIITTFGWMDADYPLIYKFYYKYPNEATNTHLSTVIGLPPIVETIFPGFHNQVMNLTVGVKVCDKYKMCSIRETLIQIMPNENLSHNFMQFINKNSYPIKTISIIRAFMQTANNMQNNSNFQQKIFTFFQDFCDGIFIELMQSDSESIEFNEILQSIGETLSSSISANFVRNSTLDIIINFKNKYIKQLTLDQKKSSKSSIKLESISSLLLIDDFIMRSNKSQTLNIIRDLEFYHSFGCTLLENPMASHQIKSEFLYYRVDYNNFNKNNRNMNNQSFVPIAEKVRKDIEGYLTINQNIVKPLMDWNCGKKVYNSAESVNCFGVCIATAELDLDQQIKSIFNKLNEKVSKLIISPIIVIQLFSPITGQNMIQELQSVSNKSINFIIPINQNLMTNATNDAHSREINCAHFSSSDNIWRTDLCETEFISDIYLSCNCFTFGYFGALAVEVKNETLTEVTTAETNAIKIEIITNNLTTDAKLNKKSIITITMNIDADFEEFICDNMNLTIIHLINELTQILHISKSMINDFMIIRGSVLLKFNVSNNGQINEQELVDKNYTITDVKGKHYSVRSVSSELQVEGSSQDNSNNENESESESSSAKTEDLVTDSIPTEKSTSESELPSVSSAQTEMPSVSTQSINLKKNKTNDSDEEMKSKTTKTSSLSPTNATVEESVTESMTTTPMSLESTSINPISIISMTITIEGDYDTVVGGDKQYFLNNVKKQLAGYLRVPLISIINMDSKPGSIIVIFELIPSDDLNFVVNRDAIRAAKLEFEQKIKQNKVMIVDSTGVSHKVLSSVDYSGGDGHKTENGFFYEGSYLILGLAIGAVVVMVVLVIVTACAVRSYMYRKYQRQIRPRTTSEMITTDLPENEVICSANNTRMFEEIPREGASSLDHYSYDSGVWIGSVPEPVGHKNIPQPPNYLPPNEMEISITPKPPSNVLRKLRKEWKSEDGSERRVSVQ